MIGALTGVSLGVAASNARKHAALVTDPSEREAQIDKAELLGWLSAFGVGVAVGAGALHFAKKS